MQQRDNIKKLQRYHPKAEVPSKLADNEDAKLGGIFDDTDCQRQGEVWW
jgi:hypothetical protein